MGRGEAEHCRCRVGVGLRRRMGFFGWDGRGLEFLLGMLVQSFRQGGGWKLGAYGVDARGWLWRGGAEEI